PTIAAFLFILRPTPSSTLFPYTTLFRSKRKSGRQVTFSTDLIYDVLRKHEPDHVLIEAAWADARARMTDVGRLADVLNRAAEQRSEEHTSELQSRENLVCRLLLEKKKRI